VARVHSLRRGAAEALELVVHGDRKSSKVVGRRIEELPVIKGAHIAAIVRETDQVTVVQDGRLPGRRETGPGDHPPP
jgi:trk system potassium uptake protein TrkA